MLLFFRLTYSRRHLLIFCFPYLLFRDEATIGSAKDFTVASLSCDQKRRLFEFILQISDAEQSIICFNLKKQDETGCKLKKFKLNDRNKIISTNNIILKKINPNFERQEKERKFVSVNDTNSEAQLYETINF